jgi:O-methyltransferase involved in polyketide biosynthesis
VPTAWLAEGLLQYLSDEAMDSLLGHVHKLSAPGSRIAADHMPGGIRATGGSLAHGVRERADEELQAIWAADQRHDPASWLLAHGWTANVSLAASVASAYRRPMTEPPENLRVMQFITGELG